MVGFINLQENCNHLIQIIIETKSSSFLHISY
jgi:hypothetical protein